MRTCWSEGSARLFREGHADAEGLTQGVTGVQPWINRRVWVAEGACSLVAALVQLCDLSPPQWVAELTLRDAPQRVAAALDDVGMGGASRCWWHGGGERGLFVGRARGRG